MFIFIAARYSDSVFVLRIHGDSTTAPVHVAFHRPDWACGHPLIFFAAIFEVSIVQYNVSVKVIGVVFDVESVRMLLG